MNNKITPALWFHSEGGKLEEVINYYKNVFEDNFVPSTVMPLGETPSGYAELAFVDIFDKKYSFMSTLQQHNSFNDALSFVITCKDQAEIDKYWEYFTKEGKEVVCGWCNDKYGLRWQVIPENLQELLSMPGGYEVMMGQKKIVIEEYLK